MSAAAAAAIVQAIPPTIQHSSSTATMHLRTLPSLGCQSTDDGGKMAPSNPNRCAGGPQTPTDLTVSPRRIARWRPAS